MDQAFTLRKIMRDRGDALAPEKTSTRLVRVSGPKGVGKTCLASHIGAILGHSGQRTLLIQRDPRQNPSSAKSLSSLGNLVEAGPLFWIAQGGFPALSKAYLDVILLEGASLDDEPILADSSSRPDEILLVVSPESESIEAGAREALTLRRLMGVDRVNLIVNRVTSAREGQSVHSQFREVMNLTDFRIDYLGHCEEDEKITQSVMKRNFLLDLDSGARSVRCMKLLAKRFRESGPDSRME